MTFAQKIKRAYMTAKEKVTTTNTRIQEMRENSRKKEIAKLAKQEELLDKRLSVSKKRAKVLGKREQLQKLKAKTSPLRHLSNIKVNPNFSMPSAPPMLNLGQPKKKAKRKPSKKVVTYY